MKRLEADIVVIGAGAAGLAATVAAAERGAKVITFEKAARTGGAGNAGGNGIFAIESRVQRAQGITTPKAEVFKAHMEHAHWRVDARLVKAYYDKSASTIDWLEKLGVEFAESAPRFPGAYNTWHLVKHAMTDIRRGGGASPTMKVLTEKARELGAEIMLKTPAKKLLKEGGRIVGVVAQDSSREEIQAKTRAVIVASGGFGDNPEWIKKYTGYECNRNFYPFRIHGLKGDGIRMAWEAGAGKSQMIMQVTHALYSGVSQALPIIEHLFQQPHLMVNLPGERFMNEEVALDFTSAGNAISSQKSGCAFTIIDEATRQYYESINWDSSGQGLPIPEASNFDDEMKRALDRRPDIVFVADSLEALCAQTGINWSGLRKTVEEYNQACELGRDELFDKDPKYLRPVKTPRFYAVKWFPGAYGSLGGIKINYKTEVLTEEYEVIPGLYAAGADANSIYGDSYPLGLPGNTAGFAINSGRIAAENALEYIKTVRS